MPKTIKKVAVIGSGVMGSGIAAHCANAGCEVLLLDIVDDDSSDRSTIAKNAINYMHKSNPEMLMQRKNSKLITPGNIDDDLHKLIDCDWVIEVIIENLDIKKKLYKKIAQNIGKDTILSSNTSTIPRSELITDMTTD